MSESTQQVPTHYNETFYPNPPGWSAERLRLLYQVERSLIGKPEFSTISLLEAPQRMLLEIPADVRAIIAQQMGLTLPMAESATAPVVPPAELGPTARKHARRAAEAAAVVEVTPIPVPDNEISAAARKRARRAAAARRNEEAMAERLPAANDD